jgi:hypothetical protein
VRHAERTTECSSKSARRDQGENVAEIAGGAKERERERRELVRASARVSVCVGKSVAKKNVSEAARATTSHELEGEGSLVGQQESCSAR